MTEKLDQNAQVNKTLNGSDSGLDALAPTPSRCTQKLAESDAAMVQGEWIAETGAQVSRQVSRQASRRDVETASQELSDSTDDDDDFPDGGLEAWLVVLGAWCVSFCSYGWINSVGTFQEYYQTGPLKEYTASQIAWIPSMQIFLMSFLSPFTGRIFDNHGPRSLLLVGSFLHVFGLMMASLSSEYYQFMLSQGLCSAIGVSASFLAAIGSVSGWFKKRRGTAFGIFATGSSLGGVVFPIMLSNLIKTVGYGWAMRSAAFIILALLIVANLTIKARHVNGRQALSKELLARPFHEKTFLLLLIGLSLVPFGLYTPINFIPTVAKAEGMRDSLAQNLIAFYNAASLIGRAGSGLLADRFGLFNIFSLSCYGAGIFIMVLWIPGGGNDAATVAFSLLFGLFSGAYIALLGALVARISPIEEVGYRNGIGQLFGAVGGLVTAPIAGAILQGPGGEIGLKAFAGAFMIVGTTGIVAARISQTGFKLWVRF
ncbi:Major facilitator superfamily domain, general substrate transporter [Metarhizium guizhouense ARSEF 977]|uniref:Major facilitator superfamily domain, general substrate transporter n=1 Tax=Metarhizium guizhouense (strain ARSEF 977) TaxID=1276136 RepID=A0A0B4GK96_METGA|nr:Major facilitator superfamily domain, general substrate transporter [Metarhizium guizhouense ARSEF 977]